MTELTPQSFVENLKNLRVPNTFNPYLHRCQTHDRRDAPQLRLDILVRILAIAHERPIQALWLGRDLGHRGGRRTGLALTDDIHFATHLTRWGLTSTRPTRGNPVSELTARYVWEVLDQIDNNVFLWNVFPLHPHPKDEPFSNRRHNAKEKQIGHNLLTRLCTLIQPETIVCLGQDAFRAAQSALPDLSLHAVRHPSFGGQNSFRRQITDLYRL